MTGDGMFFREGNRETERDRREKADLGGEDAMMRQKKKGLGFRMSALSVMMSLLFTGCGRETEKEPEDTDIGTPVKISEVEQISFSDYGGMDIPEISGFTMIRTEEGTKVALQFGYPGGEHVHLEDLALMDRVQEILGENQVGKWNGFDKSDPDVLDGGGFSFLVKFTNGTTLSAKGFNSYPKNYWETIGALWELTESTEKCWREEKGLAEQTAAYDEILEGLYAIISNPGETDYEDVPGAMGVWETACYEAGNDALNAIGYCIKDLSGDGIPELMVGTVPDYGAWVCAVYTLAEGKPQLVLEGSSRNQYVYVSDGTFYNVGSDGAASSCIGTYTITQDGTKLECQDFYFTEYDEEFGDIRVYYNTTGDWDPAKSEETDLTEEDFWMMAQLPASGCTWTLFSALGQDVTVAWLENAGPLPCYEECSIADGKEQASKIVFIPNRPVYGFTLLSLTAVDAGEPGGIEFEAEERAWPEMECPLVAEVSFTGDLPEYGFRYEDENGNTRRFAIEADDRTGYAIIVREADPDEDHFVLRGGNLL